MRNSFKIVLTIFIFLSIAVGNCYAKDKLYTAYNIWKWGGYSNAFINYKGGKKMIPAGTEVENPPLIFYNEPRNNNRLHPKHVFFKTLPDKRKHRIHFVLRFHRRATIQEYMAKTFQPKSFEELTAGMTETEINAIKKGKIVDGMSKEAVLVSWGYPPERVTRSLDKDVWVYWINSRTKKTITFNSKGRTGPEILKVEIINQDASIKTVTENQEPVDNSSKLEEKLLLLKKLQDKGLITQEEYDKKKAALLEEL
jgi:hypothetical protein